MKRIQMHTTQGLMALVFSLLLLSACGNETTSVLSEKEDAPVSDGEVEIKTTYWDGTQNIRSQVSYVDGLKEGLAVQYYRNGNKQMEIQYYNDIKEGITRVYYEDGMLYRETPYEAGLITGIQKIYHPNGAVAAEIPYREDWPGIGLKEYTTKGSDVTDNPKIEFEHVNLLKSKNIYRVYIQFEGANRSPQFWFGKPIDGQFIDPNKNIPIAKEKGRFFLEFELEPGERLKKEIDIIGEMKSKYKNPYVAAATLKLDIAN